MTYSSLPNPLGWSRRSLVPDGYAADENKAAIDHSNVSGKMATKLSPSGATFTNKEHSC